MLKDTHIKITTQISFSLHGNHKHQNHVWAFQKTECNLYKNINNPELISPLQPTFITVVSPAQTDKSILHPKGFAGLNYYNSLLDILPYGFCSSSKMQQAQLVFTSSMFSTLHCSFSSCAGYLWLLESQSNVLQCAYFSINSRKLSLHAFGWTSCILKPSAKWCEAMFKKST